MHLFQIQRIAASCLVLFVLGLCFEVQAGAARTQRLPPSDLDFYLKENPPNMAKRNPVPPIDLKDRPDFKPVTMKDLPPFANDIEIRVTKKGKVHQSGLLSTINYCEYEGREVDGEQKYRLSPKETGFKKELKVRAFWQKGKAPLAVTLLGFGQDAGHKNARSWQADLYRAGNHVLSFDSIVRNNMNEITHHGVAGHPAAEGKIMGRLIDAFLNHKESDGGAPFRDRITSIRLLGTSWGGIIAMHVARQPQAATWPLDRVLAVSPPVSLRTAALRLDRFNREDRSRVKLLKLAKLRKGYTPKKDNPSAEERGLMRAGMGYAFHGDLVGLAKGNIERYMPGLMDKLARFENSEAHQARRAARKRVMATRKKLEKEKLEAMKDRVSKDEYETRKKFMENQQKIAEKYAKRSMTELKDWSFRHYIFLLARPYWKIEGDLSDFGHMSVLMKGAPNFLQVVIADDDPLNDPAELTQLKKEYKEPQLLIIPEGGHLGFMGTKWFQAMMAKHFK